MCESMRSAGVGIWLVLAGGLAPGCGPAAYDIEPSRDTHGTIEVTARLLEIPPGAIFERELYNYATVLKYQVLEVHRGKVNGDVIYVGHYNPARPRAQVADKLVPAIGGNLKTFHAGDVHRLSLDGAMLDHFSGGVLNKYAEEGADPIYWAVWTDLVRE